jgi:glycosyltransferase involved in cell wall biosynthesis
MHIAFLNPQGNFDPDDRYWTAHPDFGGQLVYVKQLAIAMADIGHTVDILTRQIIDPAWPEFSEPLDAYPGVSDVRIVRLPAGPPEFLRKELLWPHLVRDWVPNILKFYEVEGGFPDVMTAHYGDGGLAGVLINAEKEIPFTFTAHSLGAQKMDKLNVTPENLAEMDAHYHFARRLVAERLSMNRSLVNVTSTSQERYNQYAHYAYRGAVDPADDARFAVVPPGVAMHIFDRDACYAEEEQVHAHIRAMLARDLKPGRRALPCVVASSRLDPKKNHLGLVKAFAQHADLQRQANLVIITGYLDNPLDDYVASCHPEAAALGAEGTCHPEAAALEAEGTCHPEPAALGAEGTCHPEAAALEAEGTCHPEPAEGSDVYEDLGPGTREVLDSVMNVINAHDLRGKVSMFALRGQRELAAGYRFFAGLHSVFCLTALYEPFGLAPLEAMAAGLPAVVTKFGGPSESLREAEKTYGLLVDPNDPQDVGEALFSLVNDLARWRRYAEAGYQRVLSSYTWPRTAEGYLRAISRARKSRQTQRARRDLLPIPPYFQDPTPENAITLEELSELYFER